MSTGRHHIKPRMPPRDYKNASLAGFRAILASRGSGSNWLLPTQATSAPLQPSSLPRSRTLRQITYGPPRSPRVHLGFAASSVEPVRRPSWPVSLVQRLPVACRRDRATVAAVGCHGRHRLTDARMYGAAYAGACGIIRPDHRQPRSACRR